MRLDATDLRYISSQEFRVLTAVEMDQRTTKSSHLHLPLRSAVFITRASTSFSAHSQSATSSLEYKTPNTMDTVSHTVATTISRCVLSPNETA